MYLNKLKSYRISDYVNCWRVEFNKNNYAIIPAHVAIYQKSSNNWIRSSFLDKCGNLNWEVSKGWMLNQKMYDDFAWAKIDTFNKIKSFKKSKLSIDDPINVNFYYHQVFNLDGVIQQKAELGKIIGTVYKSPSDSNNFLLESPGVGFTGMSGAICTDNKLNIVGMFVGRGIPLGINTKNILKRGVIIPYDMMLNHINEGGISI